MVNSKFFIGLASFITILNAPTAFAIETEKPCPASQAMFTPSAEAIVAAAPSIAAAITAMQTQMLQAQNANSETTAKEKIEKKAEAKTDEQKSEEVASTEENKEEKSEAKTADAKEKKQNSQAILKNVAEYKDITTNVIQSIVTEDTENLDALISKLEKATNLGLDLAKEVSKEEPEGEKLLGFLTDNVDKIKKESLDTIETNWHQGGEYKKADISFDNFAQDSKIMSANDSVLHPITAIIALQQYKKDPDSSYLEQAQAELEEVLEHITHIH